MSPWISSIAGVEKNHSSQGPDIYELLKFKAYFLTGILDCSFSCTPPLSFVSSWATPRPQAVPSCLDLTKSFPLGECTCAIPVTCVLFSSVTWLCLSYPLVLSLVELLRRDLPDLSVYLIGIPFKISVPCFLLQTPLSVIRCLLYQVAGLREDKNHTWLFSHVSPLPGSRQVPVMRGLNKWIKKERCH